MQYRGKTTSCHTQALATAYLRLPGPDALHLLEALTTVPFGVKHVPGDPNRLLDCFFDPDLGLDRLLTLLKLPFRVAYCPCPDDYPEARRLLLGWLVDGPVVLGPLTMSRLSYLFQSQLFGTMDHYIVVLGYADDHFALCDPEGVPLAWLDEATLAAAWRGDEVPEGRGLYMARQVLAPPLGPPSIGREVLWQALVLASENLRAASALALGGAAALHLLAERWPAIVVQPSLRRGLTYVLPTRIQRLGFAHNLLEAWVQASGHQARAEKLQGLLEAQLEGYSVLLARMEEVMVAQHQLEALAALEQQVEAAMSDLIVEGDG